MDSFFLKFKMGVREMSEWVDKKLQGGGTTMDDVMGLQEGFCWRQSIFNRGVPNISKKGVIKNRRGWVVTLWSTFYDYF